MNAPAVRLDDRVRFPAELPISAHVGEIAAAIAAHPVIIVAGETGAAALAGLQTLAAHGATFGITPELAGRHVLVLCTEGATDPVNYERIVGRPPA